MILSAVMAIIAILFTILNELFITKLPVYKILFGLNFLGIIFSFSSCIITQDGLDVTILQRDGLENFKNYLLSLNADFGKIEYSIILGWIVSGFWIFMLTLFKGYQHLKELRHFAEKK